MKAGVHMLFPDLNFTSIKALQSVEEVISEVDAAERNPNWTFADSRIVNVLRAAMQVSPEEYVTFRAVYAFGTGRSRKLGKLRQPEDMGRSLVANDLWVVFDLFEGLLAVAGYLFYITLRKKKVQPQTQEMYQRALIKREELKKQVESEANGSPERIDYLRSLDTVLSYAVRDLKQDINMSSSH
jgi:hypothetical protein